MPKKYLVEFLPVLDSYKGHKQVCADIAMYVAKTNGNSDSNDLDIEGMFKLEFQDTGITGKWLGNTIYEFGHKKTKGNFVTYGRIYEINF